MFVRWFKDQEHKLKVVVSSFLHLSPTVSKETETTTYANTHTKTLWTPKFTNVSFLPKLPISQSLDKQLKAPGRENMLFFWASPHFTAYKT